MRRYLPHSIISVVILGVFVGFSVHAQVMNSTNYSLDADSVNAGGAYGSSDNYAIEDTAGEIATGYGSSTNYIVHAGYQQMENVYITISTPPDPNLGNISGFLGGTASTSVPWTVTTNNASGYSLSIRTNTAPALQSSLGGFFTDYTRAGADPDFTFSVAASDSEFAYSPEGAEIVDRFRDNGSACNTGSSDTPNACWDQFTTSNVLIATRPSANAPTGSLTTVKLRAEIGSSKMQDSGTYTSTVIVTAVSL